VIDTQPLEVTDFTLGITDYFIDGAPTQGEQMDNFFINPNRKLVTRWGSELAVPAQVPLGLFRVHTLTFLRDSLLSVAERHMYYDDGGAWVELFGPDGVSPAFATGDQNLATNFTEWQDQLFFTSDAFTSPVKVYKDETGALQLRNAGLPEFPTGVTVTAPAGTGATYLYSFVLRYTYQVGTVTYVDRGPVFTFPTQVTGGTIDPDSATITLPTALTANESWDVDNIIVEIYRTSDAGDVFFLTGEVPLGTATFTDTTGDTVLQDNESLYTTDGSFSREAPPRAKYVHVVNEIGYYGHTQDDTGDGKFQVLQSIPGDPDSVPRAFFAETEQEILAVSSIYDRPLVFCTEYIYRIDNVIDSLGAGDMELIRIDDRAGCASHNSIVRTHKGVFWAGDVGFYWSDGFRVKKISDNINETYKRFVSNADRRRRIYGTYEPSNDRVIWSVVDADGNNEPDLCMVLDLKWAESAMSGRATFTTMSGGENFKPTALAEHNNEIYRADTRGYVFRHATNLFTDPKVEILRPIAEWEEAAIVYNYKSCFLDFGSKFTRKFVPRMLVSAANTTNLSLAINSSNDNNRVTGSLQPIIYRDNITWGDSLPLWGDPNARWNFQGIIEEWRRFPHTGLRCQYKQIHLTNALNDIVSSDLLGQVNVDSTMKTATLNGTFQWLPGIVDYFISFSADNFQREFLITQRSPTTIIFQDTTGQAPATGAYDFQVRGITKGEVLELNGYVIHWQYISKTHTPFISRG